MNVIKKAAQFLKEVREELSKVAWSTREELMGSTAVVIVITAIVTIFIAAIDLMFSKVLSMVFK
jgi:preprotein translocase subunit SecE